MLSKKNLMFALAGCAALFGTPALATNIGHSFFMRGSIVAEDATGTVVCIGKEDGARVGQVLTVFHVTIPAGPQKGIGTGFRRDLVGHVRIDHIFGGHFAHVSVVDGKPAVNDIVELKK
jgi:hypothetical protein